MKRLHEKEIATLVTKHIDTDVLSITLVDEGNLNYVYKVRTTSGNYYCKQALPKFRKTTESIEKLPLDINRLNHEIKAITLVGKLVKDNRFLLPKVIYFEKRNNVVILEDVARKMKTIKQKFEKGVIDPLDARLAGAFLGLQHSQSLKDTTQIRTKQENRQFYRQVIYFRTILSIEKSGLKEVLQKNFELPMGSSSVLINGDFSPKQIYCGGERLGICDFEFVCRGDFHYDLGFFIAHYELMMLIKPRLIKDAKRAIDEFIKAYSVKTKDASEIEINNKMLNYYIGTGILNRVYAVPRDKNISDKILKEVNQRAKELLA